jgi:hypothetical protein
MRTRAVANYLKKHVPGNPTVVIEFMAGAGGTKAANHLYRGARADGLIIGSAPSGMVSSAILGEAGVQYDLDKFLYLGSPNSESHYVFFTNRKLGLGSMEKLRAHPGLRIGAQTVGHPIYLTGRLFALVLGLREPKFVVGYSSPELDVAMLSGELDAGSGVASSIVKQNPEFLDKGLMDFHSIIEIPRGDKHPRFAQLPELDSFVKSDKERKLLALHRTLGSPARLLFASRHAERSRGDFARGDAEDLRGSRIYRRVSEVDRRRGVAATARRQRQGDQGAAARS